MEQEPNGEILIMTPTGNQTGFINQRILRALDTWTEIDGRGVVFATDTGFRLPSGAVRAPDGCWMSKRRWDAMNEAEKDGFGTQCPEFVIELASPSDRIRDLQEKMVDEWIANGAELAWLIEPKERRVTVYRPGQDAEIFEDPSSVQGTGCVAGFELVMERAWGGR